MTNYIYIYYIVGGQYIYDRSVSRTGLGPGRAKQRVQDLEKHYGEGNAFYTVGKTFPGALS